MDYHHLSNSVFCGDYLSYNLWAGRCCLQRFLIVLPIVCQLVIASGAAEESETNPLTRVVGLPDSLTLNQRANGYRGIWYCNQVSADEYGYKYSGGLGTYCAKHRPFAVYCEKVHKTFFCYGGTTNDSCRHLIHMVSYYDHERGVVPRPVVLLDKKTDDAHDNPVISVDDEGYIWIFSTSHGRGRPSYVHRSSKPYSIDRFERVDATYLHEGKPQPLDNFSYMQVWHTPKRGFAAFFTHYGDPAARTIMYMTSRDGRSWSAWQRLAAIDEGHYQVSVVQPNHAASAFNYHPRGKGLNHRTNLYYINTRDNGTSWRNVQGDQLTLPLTEVENAALVHDFASEGKNVYLKDILFDKHGNPVILVITSEGYESGPDNGPREWTLFHWTGDKWISSVITTSDNNYDMGSLYFEDKQWRLIAPTETGPQPYNPGGKMCTWTSQDEGRTWRRERQLTEGSTYNHTYARSPVNARHDFYALWADGHARKPSSSRLYFCSQHGDVFQLPVQMDGEYAKPQLMRSGELQAETARSALSRQSSTDFKGL